MTVRQLQEFLRGLDLDTEIVVPGYDHNFYRASATIEKVESDGRYFYETQLFEEGHTTVVVIRS